MVDVLANKDVLKMIEEFAYTPGASNNDAIRIAVGDFYEDFQEYCREHYTRGEVDKVLKPVVTNEDYEFADYAIKGVKPFEVSIIASQIGFLLGLIHADSLKECPNERD